MRPNRYRLIAFIVIIPWVAALFAPYSLIHDNRFEAGGSGYVLFLLGWLGPLSGCFAWYANLPFFYCVINLLAGRPAGQKIAIIACIISFTVFMPHVFYQFETGQIIVEMFFGFAIWLWLGAFILNAILANVLNEPVGRVSAATAADLPG